MKRALVALAVLWCGCHPAPMVHAPALPSRSVRVQLAGAQAHGKLVFGWLTPEQAVRWAQHHVKAQDFVDLAQRFSSAGDATLDATPHAYPVQAPSDATLLAILDRGTQFWSALMGGPGLIGFGEAGSEVITLRESPGHGSGPKCEGPRLQAIVVDDPGVRGTIDNDPARRFCVALPKSYAEQPTRRYPVAFLLPGFGSGEMSYLWGDKALLPVADRIADETKREVILVGVDTATKTGSTYLADSPITGAFDHFLAGPALAAIDAQLRTIPTREARALIGHSTGGFNAVSFGLRHGELFSVIGASSPDGLDLRRWLLVEDGSVTPWVLGWLRVEAEVGWPGQMLSYAADWSPGGGTTPGWPIDLKSGRPNATMKQWIAHGPSALLDDPKLQVKRFTDRIFVAVGSKDEFGLTAPARAFADKATKLGLRPTFEVDEGAGHFEKQMSRIERALRYCVERMTPAG